MDSFEKNYQMAMSFWLFSSHRNGHTLPTNGVDMATAAASQIKMEEEQRRQCQEILDKIPEHRFLMNLKQEPIMIDGNGELPLRHFGAMGRNPGHAPRGRPPASMQNNGVISPDRKHVCPHCYKAFKSRQQLMQHNLVHSNLRKYRCSFCERAFKQLSHLHQHHRIHTGEKPYRCPLPGCDRAFPQLSNLQHHIRNHDKLVDSTFQCIQCDRAYPNEATLKAHNTRMHLHAKPLDLRQNSLTRVSQPSQSGQQTINPLNITSLPPPFVNIQNSFNPERSRKRKATRPQHLFLPTNRVPPPGPLTPDDDDDVVIIEPKETYPKGKEGDSSQGLINEQYRRNFGTVAESISDLDTKQLSAFQQNMANIIDKEREEREGLISLVDREMFILPTNQNNNYLNKDEKDYYSQFGIDMRGRKYHTTQAKSILEKYNGVKNTRLPNHFNFPYGPPAYDQTLWQQSGLNSKSLDLFNTQVKENIQNRFSLSSDEERAMFEENQRRRRELIMSYHKQYAEKKLGKKTTDFNGIHGQNDQDKSTTHSTEENDRRRQFSRLEFHESQRDIPASNGNLSSALDNQQTTASSNFDDQDLKNGREQLRIDNFEFDKQRSGFQRIPRNEFVLGSNYGDDKPRQFISDFKHRAFDNSDRDTYPAALSYHYLGDDIPMCDQFSARGSTKETHQTELNRTENDEGLSLSKPGFPCQTDTNPDTNQTHHDITETTRRSESLESGHDQQCSGKMALALNIGSLTCAKDTSKIQFMPCNIQHDGDARVDQYFNSSIRKTENNDLVSSFRGRPLNGKVMEVPSGYTGIILREVRRPFNEEEDRNLTITHKFKDFNYWNLDRKPSADDKLHQALEWVHLAKVLHQPVSLDDSQRFAMDSQNSVIDK